MRRKTVFVQMVAVMMSVMMLVSCASFTNWWNNNKDNLQLAIDIAVAATVDSYPNDAVIIGKAAQAIKDAVTLSQTVTLADLNNLILNQINLPTLSGPDRKVLADLLNKIETSLNGYFVKQNITDPLKQIVIVSDMAQMVLDSLGTPAMQAHVKKAKAVYKGKSAMLGGCKNLHFI